jgi:hypothetical protein
MPNIFARSPFIVEINEASQIETKIELRIWNGTGSAPTNPTYTLSKLIPSTTNRRTTYNISPYIKEFLSHENFLNVYNVYNTSLTTTEWCNVQVKRYKKLTSSFVLIDTTTYKAFDGYGLYTEGYNEDLGDYLLKPKTYYYYYDPTATLSTQPLRRAGSVSWVNPGGYKVKLINYRTGANSTSPAISTAGVYMSLRVDTGYMADGCIFQILNGSNVVQYESTFLPKTECKYTPICCDFINRYGAWQREFFFKASKNSINVENSEYNLLQNNLVNYDVLEGQRKIFNTNYQETITVNTDWVKEDFSDNLRELMTSERILLDNRPVKLNTKSMELQKQINTKMINYTLEFQYATDIINNVV